MSIKLEQISGLMIEKKLHYPYQDGFETGVEQGFNTAINLQGQKQIGLNRERLAKRLYSLYIEDISYGCDHNGDGHYPSTPVWESLDEEEKESWLLDADNIIYAEKELFMVVE